MSIYYKPDNILKRANDFIEVKKNERALETFAHFIKNKPHRALQKSSQSVLEGFFFKFIELCVTFRKAELAKEGLYHCRNIMQQVNIKTLDEIFHAYVSQAEAKAQEAKKKATNITNDDFDMIQTPEEVLMGAVCGEDSQDRSDRVLLLPWLRFSWEAYRQSLDLLRNNKMTEQLYHDLARQAMKFCERYDRKNEFKKLCDNLRNHIGQLQKQTVENPAAIDLKSVETQQIQMETKFFQLEIAIKMELWQEAFKTIEEIHKLIVSSNKSVKTQQKALFYQKLALVFLKADIPLYHAASLHKLYHLCSDMKKNFSAKEAQRQATTSVLATLSIIPSTSSSSSLLASSIRPLSESFSDNLDPDKSRKLAHLLSLTTPPTRETLIDDIKKHAVFLNVDSRIKELYKIMELNFDPLSFSASLSALLERIEKECDDVIAQNESADSTSDAVWMKETLKMYTQSLQNVSVVKVLKQISEVYRTISFDFFHSLLPFIETTSLEFFILSAAKNNAIKVSIDHVTSSLIFCDASSSNDSNELNIQLSSMHQSLDNALTSIRGMKTCHRTEDPLQDSSTNYLEEEEELENSVVLAEKEYHSSLVDVFFKVSKTNFNEHQARHTNIEKQKEELEKLQHEKLNKESASKAEIKNQRQMSEKARLMNEAKRREEQKIMEKRDEIKKKNIAERVKELASNLGSDVLKDLPAIDFTNFSKAEKTVNDHLNKQLMGNIAKQRHFFKWFSHMVRAKHIEELKYIEAAENERFESNKAHWEKCEKERIEKTAETTKVNKELQKDFALMKSDVESWITSIQDGFDLPYQDRMQEFNKALDAERTKRLAERAKKRYRERKEKYEKEMKENSEKEVVTKKVPMFPIRSITSNRDMGKSYNDDKMGGFQRGNKFPRYQNRDATSTGEFQRGTNVTNYQSNRDAGSTSEYQRGTRVSTYPADKEGGGEFQRGSNVTYYANKDSGTSREYQRGTHVSFQQNKEANNNPEGHFQYKKGVNVTSQANREPNRMSNFARGTNVTFSQNRRNDGRGFAPRTNTFPPRPSGVSVLSFGKSTPYSANADDDGHTERRNEQNPNLAESNSYPSSNHAREGESEDFIAASNATPNQNSAGEEEQDNEGVWTKIKPKRR